MRLRGTSTRERTAECEAITGARDSASTSASAALRELRDVEDHAQVVQARHQRTTERRQATPEARRIAIPGHRSRGIRIGIVAGVHEAQLAHARGVVLVEPFGARPEHGGIQHADHGSAAARGGELRDVVGAARDSDAGRVAIGGAADRLELLAPGRHRDRILLRRARLLPGEHGQHHRIDAAALELRQVELRGPVHARVVLLGGEPRRQVAVRIDHQRCGVRGADLFLGRRGRRPPPHPSPPPRRRRRRRRPGRRRTPGLAAGGSNRFDIAVIGASVKRARSRSRRRRS